MTSATIVQTDLLREVTARIRCRCDNAGKPIDELLDRDQVRIIEALHQQLLSEAFERRQRKLGRFGITNGMLLQDPDASAKRSADQAYFFEALVRFRWFLHGLPVEGGGDWDSKSTTGGGL